MVAEVRYARLALRSGRTLRPTSRTCERFLTDTPQAQLYFEPPGAETQAIFLNFVDRFTASPLRLVTLWDDSRTARCAATRTPPWSAAHRQRTRLSRDGYGQPVRYGLARRAFGPADYRFRQAVREIHQPAVHVAEYKRSKPARSGADVRLEDISDLVGPSSTSVTETVYRPRSGPPSPITPAPCVGSRSWLPVAPRAGERLPHVNQDQRRCLQLASFALVRSGAFRSPSMVQIGQCDVGDPGPGPRI